MGKTLRSVALMAALVSSSALADLDPKVQALLNNIDIRTLNAEVAPTADGKGLVISGRWAYRVNSNATTNAIVNGISNVGAVVGLTPSNPLPYCIFDTPATIVIPPGFAVSTPSSGGATRPTFKIAEYQKCMADATITDKTKCLIRTGQTIAVGSSCLAPILKGTPPNEYHQVGDNAMAICKATPARVDFDKEEWAKFGDWLAKRMKGKEANITDAEKAACGVAVVTPAPTPTPAPVPPIATGTGYTFCAVSDDGARIRVDGNLVLDNWKQQAATKVCGAPVALADGVHDITVECFDALGGFQCTALYSSATIPEQVIPRTKTSGWSLNFFNTETPSGAPVLQQQADVIDIRASGSPGAGVVADHFSVSATTKVTVP